MGTRRSVAVLAIGILAGWALPAAATNTRTLGGPGGGPQQYSCNGDELLVGVGTRYGSWLDWAGPICVPVTPDYHWGGIPRGDIYVPEKSKSVFEQVGSVWASFLPWNLPKTFGPKVVVGTRVPGMGGDGGGAITFAVCPENFFVYGFDATVVGVKNFVARISLRCRNLTSGEESWVALPPPQPIDLPYYSLTGGDCPGGEMADGIYGRSGIYVDALGLTCRATPMKAFCENYASQAVAKVQEGQQLNCGFSGDRWSPDWNAHLNWCISLGSNQGPPNSESAARAKQVNDCRMAKGIVQPATKLKLTSPSISKTLKGTSAVGTILEQPPAGGAVAAAPGPAPDAAVAAAPVGYLITCHGGGGMTAKASKDGFVRIIFDFAAQGSLARAPDPGECAWADRGFRPGEPEMLIYRPASVEEGNALVEAALTGGLIQVHGYNNNNGAMIVTQIDGITPGQ
jgi:hypothetical protein